MKRWLGAAVLAAWFLYFAGDGLRVWFSDDDLMNLASALGRSLAQILAGMERPVATLVLKGLYGVFGFEPLGYRAVCFALMGLNAGLGARWMWKITGSGAATVLASLLFVYHAGMADLYYSTGTIYDLLCFGFYMVAVNWYAELGPVRVAVLAALAMGSKEMAVTLPVALAMTEWVCGERKRWREVAASAGVCATMVAATLALSPMAANEAYRPAFEAGVYWARWRSYVTAMLYGTGDWTWRPVAAFLALSCGLAMWLRRPAAWWGLGLAAIASAPVLLLPERSLYAFYLPYFGFCVLWGSVAAALGRWGWVSVVLAVVALGPLHAGRKEWERRWYAPMEARLKAPGEALKRGWVEVGRGSQVYFADDPFPAPPEEMWTLQMMAALVSGDAGLEVYRAKRQDQLTPEKEWRRYTVVYRLTRDRLERLR